MAEDTKPVQGTLQFNDLNFTLRFNTVGEMVTAFAEIAKAGDELTTSLTTIKQAYLGKSVMTGTHTAGSATTTVTAVRSTPPPSGGVPEGRECAHGARKRGSGTSARGAWTGWFCPLEKGDPNQCKAVFE